VGIAEIKGEVLGAEGQTVEALVMEAARQRVEAKVKERMAQVVLHETLVNMPRWCVTKPPIHLSLNELRSEQYAAEDGGKRKATHSCARDRRLRGLPGTVWPARSNQTHFAEFPAQPILPLVIQGLRQNPNRVE
jgi:hypothetical protein